MYVGRIGHMINIKCPTAQRESMSGRYSFVSTLSGSVKAQVGPPGKRVWDIGLGKLTTPSEVATLMDFANGVWGSGPFWFLPADAPVVNMLTPAAASADPKVIDLESGALLLGSPPMNLGADGVAARAVWKSGLGAAYIGAPIPAIPGTPMTAAAWVSGPGRVRLEFRSMGGQIISSHQSMEGTATPQRLFVTATVPTAAVSAQLVTTQGAEQIARPTVTMTDELYEWGDGQGCAKAVVLQPDRELVKAWHDPRTGRWSDLSFTVQEVG